jgi:ubiquinone biosynthesis protein UbiJ
VIGSDDLTTRILVEIREEVRETNRRIDRLELRMDKLEHRVDQLEAGLGQRIDGLANRITESELRTATALTAVAGTIADIHTLLKDRLDLRDRVDRCERDIDDLKRRVN